MNMDNGALLVVDAYHGGRAGMPLVRLRGFCCSSSLVLLDRSSLGGVEASNRNPAWELKTVPLLAPRSPTLDRLLTVRERGSGPSERHASDTSGGRLGE